jgi:hypothetical protein
LVHEELIDGKIVAWIMSNEQWNIHHAMTTVQADEPEAFTNACPDAGRG